MQSKTFKNFLKKLLKDGKINVSSVGQLIKRSGDYTTLVHGGFIEQQPSATGGGSIHVKNRDALAQYFLDKFPEDTDGDATAIANVNSFRNTKAGKRSSQNVILLRGQGKVWLNEIEVDLKKYTDTFGTFSASVRKLETDKVCFVENLDSYLLAERVIDHEFVFIHTYGGIGRSVVHKLKAKDVLVFPDYDYKGLHSYLLVKSVFAHATLYVPENYEALFRSRSRTIKTRNGREQLPSKEVLESTEEVIVKIRNDIFKHKRYLEQQALF